MKKNLSLVVIAWLLALAFTVTAMPVSAKPRVKIPVNPFLGNWAGIDLSDGSNLKITVRAERRFTSVKFVDSSYALCGGLPATGTGSGSFFGTVLNTNITITCKGASTPVRTNYDLFLTLTSKTTLRDINGNSYSFRGTCGVK